MNFIAENLIELAVGYLVLLSAIMCLLAINGPDDDKISSVASFRQGESGKETPRIMEPELAAQLGPLLRTMGEW